MARHQKTTMLIDTARAILTEEDPMTLRQVYYQLVSSHAIENNKAAYNRVGRALVEARKEGIIPWECIEDRTRLPHTVNQWENLPNFLEAVRGAYRRDVWQTQDAYIEAWLEKDALSGLFQKVLVPYGVTLNVGKGYDGWSSIRNAAERIGSGENAAILYFGDFDPSGEDMARSLRDRLAHFQCCPELVKCALTAEDIEQYNLPPDFAKKSDTRAATFIERHGDVSVELDALPWPVLRERIVTEVENRMDMAALEETRRIGAVDSDRLDAIIATAGE